MTGTSQFHQLRTQVKFLTAELQTLKDNQGSATDVADQKAVLKIAKQQQAQAKQTLTNSDATADELVRKHERSQFDLYDHVNVQQGLLRLSNLVDT